MNWKKILVYCLQILPISVVLRAFMSWLWGKVKETDNTLDDYGWNILGYILVQVGWLTQEDLSEITGIPGADGVPGLARDGIEQPV